MAGIELRSSAFSDHDTIPRRHAREAENSSPPLEWSGVPDDAAELALVCEDPDAPAGTFVHWLVTGIDPHSTGVDEGAVPPGGHQHPNAFGNPGWDGPQPPVGDPVHRYFFRIFALGAPLGAADGDAGSIRAVVEDQQIASGTVVGVYQR